MMSVGCLIQSAVLQLSQPASQTTIRPSVPPSFPPSLRPSLRPFVYISSVRPLVHQSICWPIHSMNSVILFSADSYHRGARY
jgi:hypothetical protein